MGLLPGIIEFLTADSIPAIPLNLPWDAERPTRDAIDYAAQWRYGAAAAVTPELR